MKRLALVALLFVVAFPLAADPLLDCATRSVWGARSVPRDFEFAGTTLFIADGGGVAIYDVSAVQATRRSSFVPTDAPSRRIVVSENHAAVVTRDGVELFRRSGAELNGVTFVATDAVDVAFSGADLITAGTRLELWSTSGSEPSRIAIGALPGRATAVRVAGDRVYVATLSGVSIFSLAGSTLTEIGMVSTSAVDIEVFGTRLAVAGGDNGLAIYDVANAAAPLLLSTFAAPEFSASAVHADPLQQESAVDRIYVVDALQRVRLFDITISGSLQQIATIDEEADAIAVFNGMLVLAGQYLDLTARLSGTGTPLRLYDVSNPASVRHLADVNDYPGAVTGVALSGGFAYVADPPLLHVVDLRGDTPREVASINYGDTSDRVLVDGNRLMVSGRGNAHVIDISNPERPQYRGAFFSLGRYPSLGAFSGDLVLEANRGSGFHVVENPAPGVFNQIGGLKVDGRGYFTGVVAMPGAAYGWILEGIKVVDLSNPRLPVVLDVIHANVIDATISYPKDASPMLLLVDGPALRIFDLTNPLAPGRTASIDIPNAINVGADGSLIYVTTKDGKLYRIDASDRATPVVTHVASGLMEPVEVSVDNGMVAVADGFSIRIFNDLAAAELAPVAPQIAVSATASRANLSWSATGTRYEMQLANGLSFASAQTIITSRTSAEADLSGAPQYVRVRATTGCANSNWSAPVTLAPRAAGVRFVGTAMQAIVARGSGTHSYDLVVENGDAQQATLAITTSGSSSGVSITAPQSIGANAREKITLRIDSAIAESGIAVLRADGGSEFRLQLNVVEPQHVARSRFNAVSVLPGIGSNPGANGTTWKSDVTLFARRGSRVQLRYVPYASTTSATEVVFDMPAGSMLVLPDIVRTVFGTTNSNGLVEVVSAARGDVRAYAVTYNDAAAGRYSQRIPEYVVDPLVAVEHRREILAGVSHDAEARTNVGFVETRGAGAQLTLRARDASGHEVATRTIGLAPWQAMQVSLRELFPQLDTLSNGSIEIDDSGSVAVFGSRADQTSGDAVFTYATPVGEASATVPPNYVGVFDVVGRVEGAANSFWRTAIQLINVSEETAAVTLRFVPASEPWRAVVRTITIPAGGAIFTDDVIGSHFSDVDPLLTQNGALMVQTEVPLVGWGRIYNTTAQGRFGQYVPLRDTGRGQHTSGSRRRIGGFAIHIDDPESARQIVGVRQNERVRTNIALVETSGRDATVTLDFFDAGGAIVGSAVRSIPAYGSLLIQSLPRDLAITNLDLRIQVTTRGDGTVGAYASMVDAGTGDAVLLPAE